MLLSVESAHVKFQGSKINVFLLVTLPIQNCQRMLGLYYEHVEWTTGDQGQIDKTPLLKYIMNDLPYKNAQILLPGRFSLF